LSPAGSLNANVGLQPGGNFNGTITVSNAATRPLPQLGALQNIEATLQFAGQEIEIKRCTGLLGGGPVAIFGRVKLFEREPQSKLPRFDLTARGDNVPLARRPDLILRTAFDLQASNFKTAPPVITGTVNLENSYYLSDLRLL